MVPPFSIAPPPLLISTVLGLWVESAWEKHWLRGGLQKQLRNNLRSHSDKFHVKSSFLDARISFLKSSFHDEKV